MQLLSQPAFTWARILNTGHCRSQPSGSCSPDRPSNIPVGRKSVELRNKQKQNQTHQKEVSHRDVWIKFSCMTVPWLGWKCKRFNHNLNVFHLVCLNLFNTHKLKRAQTDTAGGGGGGGFFLLSKDFWENVRQFTSRQPFFPDFSEVEITSRTLIPLFRPGSVHSGSVSWDNCDLHVSLCPDRFPHYAWTTA